MIAGESAANSAIGRRVDDGPWGGFQIFVLVLGALAFLMEGVANQLIGLSIPALMKDWNLPREPFAWLAALGLAGVAAGNAIGGLIGDRIGRRKAMILSVVAFGVLDLVAVFAVNVTTLAVIRFVAGLGLGALVPNTATLIAEVTPRRRRAFAVSLSLLFIPLGIVAAGFLATVILPNYGWRMLFAMGGVVPLSVAILFVFVLPESLNYLARDPARRGEAAALAKRMGIELPPEADLSEPILDARRPGIAALFAPEMRRNTICLWAMGFFAYTTSYVVLTWAPTMLAGQGLSLATTSRSLSAWSLGGFGSPLIGLAVQRWGSKKAIGGFALGAAAGTFVLMTLPLTEEDIGYFLVMLMFENLFVVSLLSSVYVLATHMYPPAYRATGTGAASSVGRLGAVASSFTGVYALQLGGTVGYFSLMCMTSLLVFVFAMAIRNHVPKSAGSRAGRFEADAQLRPAKM